MANKITISHIAQRLKIATSTVSRALNNHPNISESIKSRVWEVANEMGYGKNVHLHRANTIVIVVPELYNQFYCSIIDAITLHLKSDFFNTAVYCSYNSHENERQIMQNLNLQDVAFLVVSKSMDSTNSKHIQQLANMKIPVLMFNRVDYDFRCPKFVIDNYMDAYLATHHLIKSGYKRIAFAAKHFNCNVYNERIRAYKDALEHAEIEFDKNLIIYSELTNDDVRDVIELFLSMEPAVDAILLPNYYAALEAIRFAKNRNIAIPNQLGVLSFDEEIYSQLNTPSITTIDRPLAKMGEAIAKQINYYIDNKEFSAKNLNVFSSDLIIRGSTLHKTIQDVF